MSNFKFKKRYGQNFLKDDKTLNEIISNITVKPKSLIIEIGPGHGALTKKLVLLDADILAFEIDLEAKEELDKIKSSRLKVIYKDFLSVNLSDYVKDYENIYVVANIPYYITTPIIEKIINSNIKVGEMVLMVQKEVADRFAAKCATNEYGYFTVYLNYYYDVKKICNVPKECFYPQPKVDSAIIKLTKKSSNEFINPKDLFAFVKQCFKFKRKNLKNNLSNYNLSTISEVLKKYNHDLTNRAEDLTLIEFIDIYKNLKSNFGM